LDQVEEPDVTKKVPNLDQTLIGEEISLSATGVCNLKKKIHFKKGENFCLSEVFTPVQREGFPLINVSGWEKLN